MRIGPGEVAAEHALVGPLGVEDQRDRIGGEPTLPKGDEKREGVGAHQGVLNVGPVLAEVRRLIHRAPSAVVSFGAGPADGGG